MNKIRIQNDVSPTSTTGSGKKYNLTHYRVPTASVDEVTFHKRGLSNNKAPITPPIDRKSDHSQDSGSYGVLTVI